MTDYYKYLANKNPMLRKKLRMARMFTSPESFVKKTVKSALIFGLFAFALIFLLLNKPGDSFDLFRPFMGSVLVGYMMYQLGMKKVDVAINRRAKAIDRDVLFSGRLLLIKLNSGTPLINALEEAASGVGETTMYFQDILRNIELGTPLEDALQEATEYCPSKRLRKILFQITNALRIGIDVTNFLEAILEEIASEQLTEIVRYGKKLSSLTMFYMLVAIIVPSLGMTMFIVVASMLGLPLGMGIFLVIVFFLFVLQFIFITLFRSARPNIDI